MILLEKAQADFHSNECIGKKRFGSIIAEKTVPVSFLKLEIFKLKYYQFSNLNISSLKKDTGEVFPQL